MGKRKQQPVCYCESYCLVCEIGFVTKESVHIHNLRVACHGERKYPPKGMGLQHVKHPVTK